MARGIIVFGSPGSGTTTLGRAVAAQLGFAHFDLDDYLWRWDTEVPFTRTRPREERIALLMGDLSKHPHFLISGSMDSYNQPFVPLFDLAVLNTAPAAVRAERAHRRELALFGQRILPGGDMFEEHQRFLDNLARYDSDGSPCLRVHEAWAATLPCLVLRTDGTAPVAGNAALVVKEYRLALGL